MKSLFGKVLFSLVSVSYPVLIFGGLYFFNLSPRYLSLILMIMALFHFSVFVREKKKNRKTMLLLLGLLAMIVLVLITNSGTVLKLYPILVSFSLLGVFGLTLLYPPSLAYRLALMQDKTLIGSPSAPDVEKYCFRVTLIWCVFFVLNGLVSWMTILADSEWVWVLYNGVISYVVIGTIFLIEFIIRQKMRKKIKFNTAYTPLSEWDQNLYPKNKVICFNGRWENAAFRTWEDFLRDTSALKNKLDQVSYSGWVLHCENIYWFLVAFTAVLQAKKKLFLTANRGENFIREIVDSETGILSDQSIPEAFFIPDLKDHFVGQLEWTSVSRDADIFLYTSGTTGLPKAIHKKLFQFESEGEELAFLWGKECKTRHFITTVNHHHIYGLLFSALMPISLGAPFREERLEFPESLLDFSGENCVLVSSPAFLKRLPESKLKTSIFNNPPMVFSSGGALPKESAAETFRVTGFWPMEIYGSTETGGLAYRQSEKGLAWTPFRVNRIEIAANGCLSVYSPYLNDPEGFVTGDLVDLNPEGTFLLKGRLDSIVKIEEKRISLTEVEMRIRETGIVQDVCVVALTEARQYLAAVVVLNSRGRSQMEGFSKNEMNRFFKDYLSGYLERTVIPRKWRYFDTLPQDTQGKIKRKEIEKLFLKSECKNFVVNEVKVTGTESLEVLLTVPKASDFFNGHFPSFHLLPAVAQVDLVIRFSHQYLSSSLYFSKISRVKFVKPICPDMPIRLEVLYLPEKGKLSFSYLDPESLALFSSGTIFMEVFS